MDNVSKLVIEILLILSGVFFLLPGIIAIVKSKLLPKSTKKSEIGSIIIIVASIVAALWCLRYAVAYSSVILLQPEQKLTSLEELANSLFATIRTFKVDEDYSAFIINLKAMSGELTSHNTQVQTLLVIYATMLNIVAPVVGGAVIIDILASIFPIIKMKFSYAFVWRKKYFFSELNEASIALAKGLYEESKSYLKRPVIIFTDAYINDEDEKIFELFAEAKLIGAICVKDDISHIRKNRYGDRVFLLMDEDESTNLQALTALFDEHNSVYMKGSEIFFVTNSDAYLEIEKRVYDKFKMDFKITDEDKQADELPTFIPVQSYRNLISDMLVKIPLFEPLIDKPSDEAPKNLTVTILGAGHIGTEMFLNTYWMGQILNCTININVA